MAELKQAHSGTLKERPSERELLHGRLARELAAEGMALLKNEGFFLFQRQRLLRCLAAARLKR